MLREEFKIRLIGSISVSNRIEITDTLKNTTTTYDSLRKAALYTGIGLTTLGRHVNTDKYGSKPIKERFLIKRV